MLLKWGSWWLCIFSGRLPGKEAQLFFGGGRGDLHRDYGLVVILLFFLCNYDNLTLKLHQEKRSYPNERWLFIGRFKVGSVPGKSVVLVTCKKV